MSQKRAVQFDWRMLVISRSSSRDLIKFFLFHCALCECKQLNLRSVIEILPRNSKVSAPVFNFWHELQIRSELAQLAAGRR